MMTLLDDTRTEEVIESVGKKVPCSSITPPGFEPNVLCANEVLSVPMDGLSN